MTTGDHIFNINQQTIDVYQQKMRAQTKEMKDRVKMLEAGAENAGADMRIRYKKNLNSNDSAAERLMNFKCGWIVCRAAVDPLLPGRHV
jgi:hypothetical protein